jgi:uncharacterized protein YbjT (DUF2867 family)
MILVIGATGSLGMETCRRLALKGEKVRAFVRRTSDPAKLEILRSQQVELVTGDLKDPASLGPACEGIKSIISTASSTFSRQEGDSIATVDGNGQLSLVDAAKKAGVDRFVFVSFRRPPGMHFPLGDAKAAVEEAIAGMNFTTIQASFFMESWLSPMLGFDFVQGAVRVLGTGKSPTSWVSLQDVAELCVRVLTSPDAERKTIEFGGPQTLSVLDVVKIFETQTQRKFRLEFVPEEALLAQFQDAVDPMQKTFAALMLGGLYGDAIAVDPIIGKLGMRLTPVEEYARAVTGTS